MLKSVVIVEDDPIVSATLVEMVDKYFNVPVRTYTSAETFMKSYEDRLDSLFIIDWQLPGIPGIEIVRRLRTFNDVSPIILLSDNYTSREMYQGLEAGVDMYLHKPIEEEFLRLSIKNIYRRHNALLSEGHKTGIKIIPKVNSVIKDGEIINLTPREFMTFSALYTKADLPISRKEIVAQFDGTETTERNADVLISGLRKKVEKAGFKISTIRGKGYMLQKPPGAPLVI